MTKKHMAISFPGSSDDVLLPLLAPAALSQPVRGRVGGGGAVPQRLPLCLHHAAPRTLAVSLAPPPLRGLTLSHPLSLTHSSYWESGTPLPLPPLPASLR